MTSLLRKYLSRLRRHMHLSRIPAGLLYLANRRWVDEGGGRILHNDWRVPLRVRKGKGANFVLRGDLRIDSYQGDRNTVVITMGKSSTLHIDGDLLLGQGTKITLSEGAYLYMGGDDREGGCGTTGDCKIMVRKRVHIGKDFLCSWNVFITDSDWHTLDGAVGQKDTYIADHVWVTANCSVLKGSRIGDNCVLSNGVVVHNRDFAANQLIVGNPAVAVKRTGAWRR